MAKTKDKLTDSGKQRQKRVSDDVKKVKKVAKEVLAGPRVVGKLVKEGFKAAAANESKKNKEHERKKAKK